MKYLEIPTQRIFNILINQKLLLFWTSQQQGPVSRVKRPESSVQISASRVQRPESSIQNQASRVQRPTLRSSRVQEFRYTTKTLKNLKIKEDVRSENCTEYYL